MSTPAVKVDCHNVFWTGGWDSTFRVLQLARSGATVQPHYLVDPSRKSTKTELLAIEQITRLIQARYPGTLRPLVMRNSDELEIGREIRVAYESILREIFIGAQYMYLAAYWEETAIDGFELSIPVYSQPGIGLHRVISPYLVPLSESSYKLKDDAPGPLLVLFGRGIFPILDFSKLRMKHAVQQWGDADILEQSWFCHTPFLGRHPCGTCGPCVIAIQDGLGYRVPPFGRLRYHLRVYARIKSAMRKYPRVYRYATMLKHGRVQPTPAARD